MYISTEKYYVCHHGDEGQFPKMYVSLRNEWNVKICTEQLCLQFPPL